MSKEAAQAFIERMKSDEAFHVAGVGRYRFEMRCAATAETFAAESGFSRILTVR